MRILPLYDPCPKDHTNGVMVLPSKNNKQKWLTYTAIHSIEQFYCKVVVLELFLGSQVQIDSTISTSPTICSRVPLQSCLQLSLDAASNVSSAGQQVIFIPQVIVQQYNIQGRFYICYHTVLHISALTILFENNVTLHGILWNGQIFRLLIGN